MISYSLMSHIHELGLRTSLCFHETNPFVVQPYEPILLIVLPYRLLVCIKISKPPSLGPWHARNDHTMDSSPNSSRQEHNSSLPIVRLMQVITILRTPRHLAADENYILDLVHQAQTPETQAYNSYTLGNSKQTVQIVRINLPSSHPRLSYVPSPKRAH